jgi:PrtD family type I secretion system ABC transporter
MTLALPSPRTPASASPLEEALRICGPYLRYAFLFSAMVNLAYLAPTFYMLGVYDMVVPSGSGTSLAFLTVALALTLLVLTVLDRVRGRVMAAASARLDRTFSARLFRRAMLGGAAGQVRVNQQIRELDAIRAAATGPAALAMLDAPWIPIYILTCFFLHPAIGGLTLAGSVLLLLLALWNERATRGRARRALAASAASFAAQEAAGGSADVVRALGMTDAFVAQFEAARAQASQPEMQAGRTSDRISGLIRFLRLLLQSAALGLGAWLAINRQISAGAIFASSMLASRALGPIDQIVAQWRTLSQALTSYAALKDQLAAPPARSTTELPAPRPKLQVERAGVRLADGRTVLQVAGLAAEGGQVLGVIGPSGSGKTTLMQLLANARTPEEGEVRLDGARYADWDSRRLGRHIGYLPQDSALFAGTVKDNISRFESYSGTSAAETDALAVAAARAAFAHEHILALPNGYDTVLGPRGRGLSAGQQQRIALARALYREPVVCVFDEPDAHLDVEGEAALAAAVAALRARGALVVIAAHRAGLIGSVDLLAILRNGRLERFGPRQQVLDSLKPAGAGPRPPALNLAAASGTAR